MDKWYNYGIAISFTSMTFLCVCSRSFHSNPFRRIISHHPCNAMRNKTSWTLTSPAPKRSVVHPSHPAKTFRDAPAMKVKRRMISHVENLRSLTSLTLLSSSLSDLGTETGFDGSDWTSRSTGVAGDEEQSVLSLVEFRVGGSTCFAGHIFHCERY